MDKGIFAVGPCPTPLDSRLRGNDECEEMTSTCVGMTNCEELTSMDEGSFAVGPMPLTTGFPPTRE